jgi:rabenosyn-5
MKAMDTNKLILRLERLMTSLPVDPVKRRAHEQSIVTWLPEEDVKLCPNCAKSFNITRLDTYCCKLLKFKEESC